MKDLINRYNILIMVLCFIVGLCLGCVLEYNSYELRQENFIKSEQWGGAVPMKIYTVYDRDTGVYYAVTEKGGICVMETMSGETKLVDEGEPPIIHKNQGE